MEPYIIVVTFGTLPPEAQNRGNRAKRNSLFERFDGNHGDMAPADGFLNETEELSTREWRWQCCLAARSCECQDFFQGFDQDVESAKVASTGCQTSRGVLCSYPRACWALVANQAAIESTASCGVVNKLRKGPHSMVRFTRNWLLHGCTTLLRSFLGRSRSCEITQRRASGWEMRPSKLRVIYEPYADEMSASMPSSDPWLASQRLARTCDDRAARCHLRALL